MAAKKFLVYELAVAGQFMRLIACDKVKDQDGDLEFVADGLTVFKIEHGKYRYYQLTPKRRRKPGVTRSPSISSMSWAFRAGQTIGK